MTSENKAKTGNIILKIVLLLIIAGGIVLAVLFAFQGNTAEAFNWEQLDPRNLLEALKEEHIGIMDNSFALGEKQLIQSKLYMDDLLLLTDSDIRLMNSRGEELWYHTHELRQPVVQVNENMVLVYEQNGKSYMVLRDGKVLIRSNLEEEISFGEITSTSMLLITANQSGYKRTIYLISPENGVELGALYINDYYPYYAKTIEQADSKQIILSGLGMNSNNISTIIRLYGDNLNESPITGIELEGLYPVVYHAGQKVLFVGELGAFCYDQALELSWSKQFDNELLAGGLFDNGGTVFALESSIAFYNEKGKEVKQLPADSSTDAIEVYKNTAAVISGNEAVFYDFAGNRLGSTVLPGLSLKVHFMNEKKAFIVSEHEAMLHEIDSTN
ncbi:MAG: hypothetical protein KBA53_06960 [Thermoclostridium sp.]|nr:hypothetical protein [Thermoclostridium sp.]